MCKLAKKFPIQGVLDFQDSGGGFDRVGNNSGGLRTTSEIWFCVLRWFNVIMVEMLCDLLTTRLTVRVDNMSSTISAQYLAFSGK